MGHPLIVSPCVECIVQTAFHCFVASLVVLVPKNHPRVVVYLQKGGFKGAPPPPNWGGFMPLTNFCGVQEGQLGEGGYMP